MKRFLLSLCLVVLSVAAFAQTGPGGVGNTLGVGQPRNVIWLDATTLALGNGVDILTWPDLSGNGNTFSTSATFSPRFESTVLQNGLGYARFSKANNRIVKTSFNDMPQSAYTVVLVYRTSDTGDGLVSYAASDARPDEYLLRNSDALRTYLIDAAFDQTVIATNNNQFRSIVTSWENVDGVLDYYINGAETGGSYRNITGFKIGQNIQTGGAIAIGNDQDLLDNSYDPLDAFAGDIAEVIMYDRKLNAMQVRIVNNYIAAKYNLTLANINYVGSTPANGDYDLKVMGVGRLNGTTHNEGNSDGFILTGNTYTTANTFALAGHNSVVNSAVATNLSAGVQQRWNRSWYIDFTNTLTVDATFDLGEGIGGGSPVNKDNYVLLKLVGGVWTDQGVASTNKTINGDRISFRITQALNDGAYTLGTLDATNSPVAGINIRTWYSYQTGNWSNPDVWTLDGGVVPLLTNPANETPQPSDNVVITNGRTVTMNVNNITVAGMRVDGRLNVAASSGHNFNAIEGNGRIRLSGSGAPLVDNFPAGLTTNFADPLSGGTVEYYGSGNISLNQNRTYNNLEIRLTGGATTCFLTSNFVVNGYMSIESGTFQFNDNASTANRTLTVGGDVTIQSGTSMTVGSAGGVHEFNLSGDLTNNGGTLSLTNYTVADYTTATPTTGAVNANFISGLRNQDLICNGPSKFWRVKIDKGSDDTYKLRITSSSVANFSLLGYANEGHGSTAQLTNNLNALGLVRGTVEIGTNVEINKLGTSNYNISEGATLWVNGGLVVMPAAGGGNATVVYGKAKVSAGTFNSLVPSGFTLRVNGTLEVEGGSVTANQIRTSVLGTSNIGGYIQTGGTVVVNGTAGTNTNYYTFSMTYPGNVFRMSGGTLTIRRASNVADRGILFLNSDPQNISVTGGTVTLEMDNNLATYVITSKAPLWNLILRKTANVTQSFKLAGGTSGDAGPPDTRATIAAQPLVVLNSLTIDNTGFNATLDAQGIDVEIGKDFLINSGATYTTGANTTKFTGTANGILNLGGAARSFNNFYFEKATAAASLDIQNGVAAPTATVTINGTFSTIRGTLSYGAFVISAKGNVVNNSTVGVVANTGKVVLDGASAQTISSNNGTFFNLELNNVAGINLTTGTLNVSRVLTMTNGLFNIGINKLVMLGVNASIAGTGFGTTKMIQTAGNSSDGGLEMYYNAAGVKTYPIGTNANAVVRYTPAIVQIVTFTDDGYIQVNPADQILATTNSAGGADILSYYWRFRSRDFAAAPTVAYNLNYSDSDVGGTEANYVPGRVLDASPFTRATDGPTSDMNTTTNNIFFNGSTTGGTFPGAGFTLVAASYTAGAPARFTGAPTIYYSRSATATGFPGLRWDQATSWSTVSHVGAAATNFPQAGDVAIIGSGNTGANNFHSIDVNSAIARAAQVVFAVVPAGTYQPRLTIQETQGVDIGRVSGPGTVMVRATNTQVPSIAGDFGDFSNEVTSLYDYVSESGALISLPTNPSVFPNLRFEGGTATFARRMTIPTDIIVRRNLLINQQANFVPGGNITVGGSVNFSDGTPGRLEFPATGSNYTMTVAGDIIMNASSATNQLAVANAPASTLTHRLSVAGNIAIANGTIDLFNGNAANDNNVVLEFTGATNNTVTNTGGGIIELYRIEMNKGTSITSTMTMSANFTLNGPTNTATNALQLKNGLLILDDPGINFTLSSGNGDFSIPSTAGLEVKQGQVNVSGVNTGILLDGLLRISGGIVNMDDAVNGGNNYIEYSASGNAQLEVTSGGLIVGSQIRRGLTSTAGILRYIQSGGSVTIAKNAAPQTNRGVLEILNTGSRFNYTGGSLTVVQGINSAFVPSILIDPTNYSFPATQTLTIGNGNTPNSLNAKNIGIKTSQIFGSLVIDNTSSNDPIVKLYALPLIMGGSLTINNGATLNAQGFDLQLRNNFINNGSYLASGNKTIFAPAGTTRTVSGTGTFDIYKMDKTTALQLSMSTNLVVNNELRVLAGTISTGTNFLIAKQNVVFDGVATSTSGLGLVFEGTAKQTLSRTENTTTSTLSIITIRNSNGVEIPDGQGYKFTITNQLRLESGLFDVGGNLLLLTAPALIVPVNPFSVGNMIRTNSSFSDSGIRKIFPAGYVTDFTFPVGQARYTPITFNFGSPGKTTGTGTPTITIRTAEEPHPSVVENSEAPNPEIVDINNVLQYYYTIDADNIATSFNADAILTYDNSYVAVTTPYTVADYITARIREDNNPSENVDKNSGVINTAARTLTFSFSGVTDDQISGDYFAGVDDAIPANVPIYTTVRDGNVNDPGTFGSPAGLTGTPTGAIVVVSSGTELDFNTNSVRLYKTIINANSVLDIQGTYGHRLGSVTGTGTLKITSNTSSAVMPAGFFEDFFGCSGGSLEYSGTGSYDILGGITDVRNLTLSNSGDRLLANNDLHVCNDFIVTGPTFLNSNNRAIVVDHDLNLIAGSFDKSNGNRTLTVTHDINVSGGTFVSVSGGTRTVGRDINISGGTFNVGSGGNLVLKGSLIKTAGTFNGGSGTVKMLLNGTTTQIITGNFSGASQIHRLELDNTFGLNLNGNVDINAEFLFTNGLVNPGANILKLNSTAIATPVNGSSISYVAGRLYKDLNSGSSFSFPIGKSTRWRYAKVNNTTAGLLTWYAEYFIGNARTLEAGVTNQASSDPSILIVSGSEYWKIGDNAGATAAAQIGLSWGIQSDVSSNASNRESLKVMAWNGSLWDNYGGINFLAGHTQSQGDFTTATNISFPSTFKEKILTLGTTNLANPLPVELTSFTASMTSYNTALLKWHTETETQNDRFEIERSQDGFDFAYLGEVKGNGTTTKPHDYTFVDEKPLGGVSYYRLKQVDLDGSVNYSDIRSITNNEDGSIVEKFVAYPNPIDLSRNTTVNFNRKVNVIIYNNLNKLVREYRGVDSFDASGLPAGLYILRTSRGETFKLLVK